MDKSAVLDIDADMPDTLSGSKKNKIGSPEIVSENRITDFRLPKCASWQFDAELFQIGHINEPGAIDACP